MKNTYEKDVLEGTQLIKNLLVKLTNKEKVTNGELKKKIKDDIRYFEYFKIVIPLYDKKVLEGIVKNIELKYNLK